jgi:hypothetical protein
MKKMKEMKEMKAMVPRLSLRGYFPKQSGIYNCPDCFLRRNDGRETILLILNSLNS